MKYAIQNTSGQWWTGECWGVEQTREEYEGIMALPFYLDGETEKNCGLGDAGLLYYDGPAMDAECVAVAREV